MPTLTRDRHKSLDPVRMTLERLAGLVIKRPSLMFGHKVTRCLKKSGRGPSTASWSRLPGREVTSASRRRRLQPRIVE
jgi:hypothetical protein